MREFPAQMGVLIASMLRTPADAFVPCLEAAMMTFLRLRGDQHEAIDRALDRAAARWRAFPAHLMQNPPPPPPFKSP